MIIRLLTTCLALGASLGGLYTGVTTGMSGPPEADAEQPVMAAAASYRTDFIAIPLIAGTDVEGYVIGRYVLGYDPALARDRAVPLPTVIRHGVNAFFYGHSGATFWMGGPMAVPDISEGMVMAINQAAGAPVITGVSIRQMDFLQGQEIRQPLIELDR